MTRTVDALGAIQTSLQTVLDRAVQVRANTGEPVGESTRGLS